ncbi:hypothetical protein CBR_g3059 [Chara braunii]|uniref:Major facilitator superfamily (MFS) profile domain-containing protein n=1 Tax=Chara braunii TaxID=69332 RepID=A0A388KEM4_CHABU|nr:hypothetical protein CBR_g3059 [Chara braunii]|eukprot:GBG68515.1 hypothetical protein CBR_g3059 [Chara braunii]
MDTPTGSSLPGSGLEVGSRSGSGSARETGGIESGKLAEVFRPSDPVEDPETCPDVGGQEKEELTIDKVLVLHVGEFGFGQFWNFALAAMSWVIVSLMTLVMMFTEKDGQWTCVTLTAPPLARPPPPPIVALSPAVALLRPPLLPPFPPPPNLMQNLSNSSSQMLIPNENCTWGNFSGPNGTICSRLDSQNQVQGRPIEQTTPRPRFYEECTSSSSICSLNGSQWEWVDDGKHSIVSEFDLICSDEYKSGISGSLFFVGRLLGGGFFGSLADGMLGRRGTLITATAVAGTFSLLSSFSPAFAMYAVFRLMAGFGCGGIGSNAFVLATEPIGPSHRSTLGMSTMYFYSLGVMILALLGFLFRSWRHVMIAVSIPSLVYSIVCRHFLIESPRWLLVWERGDEALNILKKMAQRNGKSIPPSVTLTLTAKCKPGEVQSDPLSELNASPPQPGQPPTTGPMLGSGHLHDLQPQRPDSAASMPREARGFKLDFESPVVSKPAPPAGTGGSDIKDQPTGSSEIVGPSDPHPPQQKGASVSDSQTVPGDSHIPVQESAGAANGEQPLPVSSRRSSRHSVQEMWDKLTKPPMAQNPALREVYHHHHRGLKDIMLNRRARHRLVALSILWLTCSLLYYGLALSSVNLGNNVYLQTFLNGLVEIPSFLIATMLVRRLGRKRCVVGGIVLGALSSFFCALSPLMVPSHGNSDNNSTVCSDNRSSELLSNLSASVDCSGVVDGNVDEKAEKIRQTLRVISAMIGYMGIAATYTVTYVYTSELFPTEIRATAMAFTGQIGQIGSACAPFVVLLARHNKSLPYLVFGSLGIISAFLISPLPETRKQDLPEVMEEDRTGSSRCHCWNR